MEAKSKTLEFRTVLHDLIIEASQEKETIS